MMAADTAMLLLSVFVRSYLQSRAGEEQEKAGQGRGRKDREGQGRGREGQGRPGQGKDREGQARAGERQRRAGQGRGRKEGHGRVKWNGRSIEIEKERERDKERGVMIGFAQSNKSSKYNRSIDRAEQQEQQV